jgi:ferredoxin-NADP reductase
MAVHHDTYSLVLTANQPETPGFRSLFFARPRGFSFEAGDWMDLNLPDNQPAGGTTYSFASSPDEPELRITFRDGQSPFKRVLHAAEPGDRFVIAEYGNDYGFQLSEHRASTLIAGGVGVAPFRSMLAQMAGADSRNAVRLIYFNSSADFLYRNELDAWQRQLAGLTVHCVATKELKRKDRERLLRELIAEPMQQFYISGPSGMVQNTRQALRRFGVDEAVIKIDDFGVF